MSSDPQPVRNPTCNPSVSKPAPPQCSYAELFEERAGNVIILGADPAKHAAKYASNAPTAVGARNLIAAGITYAATGTDAGGSAATGAYICLSQYFYFTVRCDASNINPALYHPRCRK